MYNYKSPARRSLTRVFLAKFIITKHLKQEVDYNLTICMDKCHPCSLPITGDKIYQFNIIKR